MMVQLLRSLAPLLITGLLLGCGEKPPAQESCNFVQNQFGRRVSWVRMPIQFYADRSVSIEQFQVIVEAMQIWNEHFDAPVFEMIGRTQDLPAARLTSDGRVIPDGYNGIYMAGPDLFVNSRMRDEQGRASISFRGDFIYEADVLLDNSENFFYEDMESARSRNAIHFKSLVVHELGHVLGLDHDEESHVMAEVLAPGFDPRRIEIAGRERESLACQY